MCGPIVGRINSICNFDRWIALNREELASLASEWELHMLTLQVSDLELKCNSFSQSEEFIFLFMLSHRSCQ